MEHAGIACRRDVRLQICSEIFLDRWRVPSYDVPHVQIDSGAVIMADTCDVTESSRHCKF